VKLDVAILGAGMGGGLLARQLAREMPGQRIGVFDKDTETSYKVGESTVEIGSSYMIRRVGLSRYLYENHLPKNGLRYFFDDENKSAELTEMSEIGTINLPFHPAFQVDRARLDADLQDMNQRAGIGVHLGARVTDLELGSDGAAHRFRIEREGRSDQVECRWLLDATGRAALLSRALGLRVRDETHRLHSVWGRFEGVADVDDWGDPAFTARVRHTSRGISTIHFCYPGYWIWFIPLGGGVTSIGFVGEPPVDPASMRSEAGFRAFLESHRAIASLLTHAKPIDTASLKNFTYGTRRFFSRDRWGLIGEAAAFGDPLYSPGADFIAIENDFLCDLVRRDLGGEADDEVARRVDLYDDFMAFRYEAAMRLYRGLYGMLGSYELMRLKWDFDIGCYYNLWVDPYLKDQYLDERFVRRQVRQQRFVLQALQNFAELFQQTEAHLRKKGEYYRNNLGLFAYGLENIDFVEEVGLPRTQRVVLEKTAEIFNGVRRRGLALQEREAQENLALTTMMTPRPLV
jgi:flavin-dependent dehydrogenase